MFNNELMSVVIFLNHHQHNLTKNRNVRFAKARASFLKRGVEKHHACAKNASRARVNEAFAMSGTYIYIYTHIVYVYIYTYLDSGHVNVYA